MSCATTSVHKKSRDIDVSGIRPVTSRVGVGHVCPISETFALTAAHVESWRSPLMSPTESIPVPLMGEINGAPVTLFRVWTDLRRDLSMVGISGSEKFPTYYRLAKKVPEPGDKLKMRWFNIHRGFEEQGLEVEVMNLDFGHLFLTKNSDGFIGASGGCMLNEAGEVVAIYVASYPKRSGTSLEWMGDGELVAGPWGTYHESFVRGSKP
jgi:hypothetical protein